MYANNIKLLTDEQRCDFNKKYSFEYIDWSMHDTFIQVICNTFNRPTFHSLDDKFKLSCGTRNLTITPVAMKLKRLIKTSHTLIDVQCAVNTLLSSNKEPTLTDLEKLLK